MPTMSSVDGESAWALDPLDTKLRLRNKVLVSQISRYRHRVQSLELRVAELESTPNTAVDGEVTALRDHIASIESQMSSLEDQFEECRAELDDVRDQLESATGTIEDMYADKFALEDAKKILEEKLQNSLAEIVPKKKTCDNCDVLQDRVEMLETIKADMMMKIVELEDQYRMNAVSQTVGDDVSKTWQKETLALRSECERYREDIGAVRTELAIERRSKSESNENRVALHRLHAEYDAVVEEKATLISQVGEYQQMILAEHSELLKLEEVVDSINSENKALRDLMEQLKDKYSAFRRDDGNNADLSSHNQDLERAQLELLHLKNKYDACIEQKKIDDSANETNIQMMASQIEKKDTDYDALKERWEASENRQRVLLEEMHTLRSHLSDSSSAKETEVADSKHEMQPHFSEWNEKILHMDDVLLNLITRLKAVSETCRDVRRGVDGKKQAMQNLSQATEARRLAFAQFQSDLNLHAQHLLKNEGAIENLRYSIQQVGDENSKLEQVVNSLNMQLSEKTVDVNEKYRDDNKILNARLEMYVERAIASEQSLEDHRLHIVNLEREMKLLQSKIQIPSQETNFRNNDDKESEIASLQNELTLTMNSHKNMERELQLARADQESLKLKIFAVENEIVISRSSLATCESNFLEAQDSISRLSAESAASDSRHRHVVTELKDELRSMREELYFERDNVKALEEKLFNFNVTDLETQVATLRNSVQEHEVNMQHLSKVRDEERHSYETRLAEEREKFSQLLRAENDNRESSLEELRATLEERHSLEMIDHRAEMSSQLSTLAESFRREKEKLLSELEDWKKASFDFTQRMEILDKNLQRVSVEKDFAVNESERLAALVSESWEENEQLRSSNMSTEARYQILLEEFQSSKQRFSQVQEEISKASHELENNEGRLPLRSAQSFPDASRLEDDCANLTRLLDEKCNDYCSALSTISSLEEDLSDAKRATTVLREQLNATEHELLLMKSESKFHHLRKQNEILKEEICRLTRLSNDLQNQKDYRVTTSKLISSLRFSPEPKDRPSLVTQHLLQKQVSDERTSKAILSSQLTAAETRILDLENEITNLENLINDITESNSERRSIIVSPSQRQRSQWEHRIALLSEQLKEYAGKEKQRVSALEVAEADAARLCEKSLKLEEMLGHRQEKILVLTDKCQKAECELSNLNAALVEERGKVNSMFLELSGAKTLATTLTSQINKLENDVNDKRLNYIAEMNSRQELEKLCIELKDQVYLLENSGSYRNVSIHPSSTKSTISPVREIVEKDTFGKSSENFSAVEMSTKIKTLIREVDEMRISDQQHSSLIAELKYQLRDKDSVITKLQKTIMEANKVVAEYGTLEAALVEANDILVGEVTTLRDSMDHASVSTPSKCVHCKNNLNSQQRHSTGVWSSPGNSGVHHKSYQHKGTPSALDSSFVAPLRKQFAELRHLSGGEVRERSSRSHYRGIFESRHILHCIDAVEDLVISSVLLLQNDCDNLNAMVDNLSQRLVETELLLEQAKLSNRRVAAAVKDLSPLKSPAKSRDINYNAFENESGVKTLTERNSVQADRLTKIQHLISEILPTLKH